MSSYLVLYLSEIKKILLKKSVWVALIVSLGLVALVGVTCFAADGKGAYIKHQEEALIEISGQKIDQEFIDNYHREVQEELQRNSDIYSKINADEATIYLNASRNIGKEALYDFFYNIIRDKEKIATMTEDDFYTAMRENVIHDGHELNCTDAELNKCIEAYEKIDKPMVYSYSMAYTNLLEVLFIVGWTLIIVTSVALSGVFADEKKFRTDALILSTRKGRTSICIVKILASITVSLLQSFILLGGCFGIMFGIYGATGWNAMIQNIIPTSLWNITIGQMVLIYIALAVGSSIFFAMTNMLVSYITKSAVATMAAHAAIIFVGLFNVPTKLGLISKLWELRPSLSLYYGTFCNYYKYGVLNNVQITLILYFGISIALALLLLLIYRKAKVESR